MCIIRRILILILVTVCCSFTSNANNDDKPFKKEGNTYSSTGRINKSSTPTSTGFTWKDINEKKYPIYISSSGSCYIIKVSKKSRKEYKSYLNSEISKDICNRLNIEYKGKK